MSASIARYLKDFGAPPPQIAVDDIDPFAPDIGDFAAPVEDVVDIETERAEAYAKGRDEATEELQRRWDEERAGMIESHRAELAALQARFEGEIAQNAATCLQEFAVLAAQTIADQAACVLAPLVEETLAAKAVADLAEQVREAVLKGEAEMITVRGPLAMFEQLRTRLGDEATVIRHVEASDIDLTVQIGDASLVTRMSAWSASLKKVLG